MRSQKCAKVTTIEASLQLNQKMVGYELQVEVVRFGQWFLFLFKKNIKVPH